MFYNLLYRQKADNPKVTEVFNDFQEKLGMIKLVTVPGKKEYEATIFSKKIMRSFKSLEEAKRFVESNV